MLFGPTSCCLGRCYSTSYRLGENLEIMNSRFNIINIELLSIKIQTLFPEK